MSTPDLSAFNFSFDPTLDTWAVSDEPAELDSPEIFLPNVEGRTEFLPPDPDRVPVIENSVPPAPPTSAPASFCPRCARTAPRCWASWPPARRRWQPAP